MRALSGADLVSDDFTVTLDDGLGGQTTAVLSFPVQGYGIKIDDLATDNTINKAEADAGVLITGQTNPNQEITLEFSSGATLEGTNVTTSDEDGNWSVALTAVDVEALGQLGETLTASMTLDSAQTVVVTMNAYKEFLFDGVPISSFTMQAGTTYTFDQSDASNEGWQLKLSENIRGASSSELSDADSTYEITGSPGSDGAKTVVKLAADLATTGTSELFFFWEVDGGIPTAGDATFSVRLQEGIIQYYSQSSEEWKPIKTLDDETDDRLVASREYTLDVSDSSLTGVTIGVSTALDDPDEAIGGAEVVSSGTPGQDNATVTIQLSEDRAGESVYIFAADGDGVIPDAAGHHTVVTQSPPIDITDAVEVVSDLKSFDVDTIIPTSTISEVDYDSDLGVITIRGENFTTIATEDSDVADLLNWNNFVWDIDGDDGTTRVMFSARVTLLLLLYRMETLFLQH